MFVRESDLELHLEFVMEICFANQLAAHLEFVIDLGLEVHLEFVKDL